MFLCSSLMNIDTARTSLDCQGPRCSGYPRKTMPRSTAYPRNTHGGVRVVDARAETGYSQVLRAHQANTCHIAHCTCLSCLSPRAGKHITELFHSKPEVLFCCCLFLCFDTGANSICFSVMLWAGNNMTFLHRDGQLALSLQVSVMFLLIKPAEQNGIETGRSDGLMRSLSHGGAEAFGSPQQIHNLLCWEATQEWQ